MAKKAVFTPKIVDHRHVLVLLVVVVSVIMAIPALRVELDRTLKSAFVTSSQAFATYKKFLSVFGDDEFILVAVQGEGGPARPALLKAVAVMTSKLEELPEVEQVLSLANMRVFQDRKGTLGAYPLVMDKEGIPTLPPEQDLERVRRGVPLIDYLISRDLRTLGILIRLRDKWKFDPHMGQIQDRITRTISENLPAGAQLRMTGAAVIREHVQDMTVRTAVMYGILCIVVTALTSLYIFKSIKISLIQTAVIGVAVEWVLGFMSLAGIPLNSTTSLVFGLILVISVSTVIHIVTHYYEASRDIADKPSAAKAALKVVGRPCLMCAATTSVAFATVMISSIPMVQQLGFAMAVGVLIAFVISMVLTPAFLIVLKPIDQRTHEQVTGDTIHRIFQGLERFVFRHSTLATVLGVVFTIAMFAGAPRIAIDTQMLGLFTDSSATVTDLRFVEQNLAPVRCLEVVVQAQEQAFKRPEILQKVSALQRRLEQVPQVESVDSPLSFLRYVHSLLSQPGSPADQVVLDRKVLVETLSVISFSADGKKLLHRYFDNGFSQIRLTLRLRGSLTKPMGAIISDVERIGNDATKGWGKFIVTGEQAVFAAQAMEVVNSQVLSVILAMMGVTVLLMIQLRSVALGLISLIPNVPPVAVIFGMMGWLGIPLDNVTVFAAAIAIGLAVDDTIHYLTQLRREIRDAPSGTAIEECVKQSYETTARAMISTSVVLLLGFLMLCFTPTKPAIYFGFLGAAAVLTALLGDLVIMPAIILSFGFVRNVLNRKVSSDLNNGA